MLWHSFNPRANSSLTIMNFLPFSYKNKTKPASHFFTHESRQFIRLHPFHFFIFGEHKYFALRFLRYLIHDQIMAHTNEPLDCALPDVFKIMFERSFPSLQLSIFVFQCVFLN